MSLNLRVMKLLQAKELVFSSQGRDRQPRGAMSPINETRRCGGRGDMLQECVSSWDHLVDSREGWNV